MNPVLLFYHTFPEKQVCTIMFCITLLDALGGPGMESEDNCPVEATPELIGGKYEALILRHLSQCVKPSVERPPKCWPSSCGSWKPSSDPSGSIPRHFAQGRMLSGGNRAKPDARPRLPVGLGCRIPSPEKHGTLFFYDRNQTYRQSNKRIGELL